MQQFHTFNGRSFPIIPDTHRRLLAQSPCRSCTADTDDDLCDSFACNTEAGGLHLGAAQVSAPEGVDRKPTNPKEAIGSTKVALDLVPDTLSIFAASAFYEGATKYGSYNWRVAGVRASTYKAAAERHIKRWWNGENTDPKTKVRHLANAIACLAIILDAETVGKLNDDRPPKVDLGPTIEEMEATLAHLKQMHAGMNPVHHREKAENA